MYSIKTFGAPNITNKPANPDIVIGSGATETVTVNYNPGNPPAMVQWSKGGQLINSSSDPRISRAPNSTILTLTNNDPNIRGRYLVNVSNIGGSDTFEYNVKAVFGPNINLTISSLTSNRVRLTCFARGYPRLDRVSWQTGNGAPVSGSVDEINAMESATFDFSLTSTLDLEQSRCDSNIYRCSVSRGSFTRSTSITCQIGPPTTPPPTTPPPTTPPPTTPPPTTPPPTTPPPTTPPPTTPPPTTPPTVGLRCFEVPIADIYSMAFNCTANTTLVNIMCSFDGKPSTNCTFPVTINFLDFNLDPHYLVISVVDVNGQRDQFVHNFTGYVPDRVQIRFLRNMTSSVEGGTVDLIFGRNGYSFGDVSVRITPLTYDQFETRGYDLDNFFPVRPPAASISDINTTVITDYNIQAGFSLYNFQLSIPIPDDTILETSEGYVYLLEVIGPIHPRDVGRIENTTNVLLVTINGTDGRIQITMAPREVVITEGEVISLTFTRNGFSYGSIPLRLLLLTYDEYRARGFNLDDSYPMRPIPAGAGVDFNTSVFELSFGNSEQLITLSFSTNDDSLPELTEGFLCYLEIIENQLHPHDVGRIDFFNRLVLVRILDNDAPVSCTSAVEENTATIDCAGIDQLPTDSNISCTIDGEPTGCTFPFRIDVSQFRGGQPQHQVRVMTQSPGDPQRQMVGGAQFIVPELTLSFVDNTPLLNVDTLTARFVANRPGIEIYCYFTIPGVARENCSSGFFRYTNIPPGVYKLRVVAWDPVRKERAVIRNRVLVHRDDTFCAVLKTNNGLTIGRNNNVTVEFSGTGRTTGFQCILDKQQPYFECESPLMLANLTVGTHHFKIIPQGCGRRSRAYPLKFTIN